MTTATKPVQADLVAEGRDRSGREYHRRSMARKMIFHVGVFAIAVVVLYPLAWMIMSALKPSNEIIGNVSLIPENAALDNFRTALDGIGGVSTATFFVNSTILAVGSVLGIVLSSALTAYAFARITFPGRAVWFSIMIGTLLLPFHVVIIPQYILFQRLGLIDTFFPLLIGKFLAVEAFFVFLMVQFMRNLPRELDEAARIDGAGHLRIFVSIMLPLMRPAIITSSIFAFIWSWNDFLGPLLYLKSPSNYSVPVALRLFVDQTTVSDFGGQMAMAVLALVPVLLFFLVFQRFLIAGVATQGLKG